jgi:hypothetical protein
MNRLAFVAIAVFLVVATTRPVAAEEGMWLLNDFPSAEVGKRHGFTPSGKWLDKVRSASVRLAGGCSGSFVSGDGLVLTNHHCVSGCVQQLSTADNDLMANGFVAKGRGDEVRCPQIELNQLVEIRNVTDRLAKVTAGKDGAEFMDLLKGEMSRIETECTQGGKWRCDVVSLYQGGEYHLYRYKRYQDVRLAFAPEYRIAFFGGDPDNFNFPRFNLDMALIRAYENGKPAKPGSHLRMSRKGAREGELVFVSGHPGRTQRLITMAQLEFLRDVATPARLVRLAELRGLLSQFALRGPEQKRVSLESMFMVENAYKAFWGRFQALLDRDQMAKKTAHEQALRNSVAGTPDDAAWDAIAAAQAEHRDFFDAHAMLEMGWAFPGDLFRIARTLVRGTTENGKPNEERLREFTDAARPTLLQGLYSEAPIHAELEEVLLAFGLTKLREILGADHPTVRQVLGTESPEDLARDLVKYTDLADVSVRKTYWESGAGAVDASADPMLLLARMVDGEARALRERFEDSVESVVRRNAEVIAKAHFANQTEKTYPDATFTLRLTYGTVKGYQQKGRTINPITTIAGGFDRATGKDPFALPESWLAAKDRLDMNTPFNFASTCDIIGGNSGSPVVNKDLSVVGLIFDGNIQSLGGDFWFDEAVNRAVSVSSAAMVEALKKVYGADRLLKELAPK